MIFCGKIELISRFLTRIKHKFDEVYALSIDSIMQKIKKED